MPSIDGRHADRPSTRCGGTGLEEAARRDARQCSERTARPPLARSWPTLTRHMRLLTHECAFHRLAVLYNDADLIISRDAGLDLEPVA